MGKWRAYICQRRLRYHFRHFKNVRAGFSEEYLAESEAPAKCIIRVQAVPGGCGLHMGVRRPPGLPDGKLELPDPQGPASEDLGPAKLDIGEYLVVCGIALCGILANIASVVNFPYKGLIPECLTLKLDPDGYYDVCRLHRANLANKERQLLPVDRNVCRCLHGLQCQRHCNRRPRVGAKIVPDPVYAFVKYHYIAGNHVLDLDAPDRENVEILHGDSILYDIPMVYRPGA
jgi:hypothetical protein